MHGFYCDSEVGRVFNILVPDGFDYDISQHRVPGPQVGPPKASWRRPDRSTGRPVSLPTAVPPVTSATAVSASIMASTGAPAR